MSMYTHFKLSVFLSNETPSEIINALKHIIETHLYSDQILPAPYEYPEYDFFKTKGYYKVFSNYTGDEDSFVKFDCIEDENYMLAFISSFTNYDSQFEELLKMIHPYVIAEECDIVGIKHYEEWWNPANVVYTKEEFKIIHQRRK